MWKDTQTIPHKGTPVQYFIEYFQLSYNVLIVKYLQIIPPYLNPYTGIRLEIYCRSTPKVLRIPAQGSDPAVWIATLGKDAPDAQQLQRSCELNMPQIINNIRLVLRKAAK